MAIKKISANLLGNNAVTAANIAGGAISAADIADNSITAAKLSASTSPTFGGLTVQSSAADIILKDISASDNEDYRIVASGGGFQIQSRTDAGVNTTRALFNNNGDISFYEDTGTTAKFFWDSSAENLTITGQGNQLLLARSGGTVDTVQFGTGTVSPITGLFIQNATDSNIMMKIDDSAPTDSFVLNSSGNVGIGTDSPSAPLTIGYSGAEAQLQINNSGSNRMVYLGAFSDNEGILRLFNSSNVETVRIPAESTAGIHTYFNAGNVGIGTPSPEHKLHLKSTSSSILQIDASETTTGAADTGAGILFVGHDGANGRYQAKIASAKTNSTSGNYSADLVFSTRYNGDDLNEKMRLYDEGNLEIKNIADNGLSLNKQVASTWNYIEFKNQSTRSHYIGTDSGAKFTLGSDSGAAFYFTGGYVGIGESTPQTEFHVKGSNNSAGDLWTAVGSGNVPSITIQNASTTDNNNAALFFRNDSGMFASIGARFVSHTTDETELRFSTTNSSGTTRERVTIDGDGNVAIGTTSASNGKLTILSDDAGETGAGGIILNTTNSSLRIGGTNGRSWIQSHASQPLWINKEGNNVVFNYSAGNVIVGNGSGTDKFNVYGTSLFNGNTYIGSSSTLYIPTGGNIKTYSGATTYGAMNHTLSVDGNFNMLRIGGADYPAHSTAGDFRSPSPNDFQSSGVSFHFTSYALNNSANWADMMVMSTYVDSSGGEANAFLISKSSNGVKIARQGFNSASNFSAGSIYTLDYTSASDSRVKENVQNITNGLDLISQLRPVTYEWTDEYILSGASKNANENIWNEETEKLNIPETKTTNVGLIAQEVESIIPTVVHEDLISIPGVEGGPIKNISYEKLVPHLISAIKELKQRVEELEG